MRYSYLSGPRFTPESASTSATLLFSPLFVFRHRHHSWPDLLSHEILVLWCFHLKQQYQKHQSHTADEVRIEGVKIVLENVPTFS